MDGDTAAKAMDRGASAATKENELTQGIHEDAGTDAARGNLINNSHAGTKTADTGKSVFDSAGTLGKQFTTDGAIGGAAGKVGGPLSSEGVVGKAFTDKGSIGGSVQNVLGSEKKS